MISLKAAECQQPSIVSSIMMLNTVASNGEKMLPVWFEMLQQLTKKFWRRKFFYG